MSAATTTIIACAVVGGVLLVGFVVLSIHLAARRNGHAKKEGRLDLKEFEMSDQRNPVQAQETDQEAPEENENEGEDEGEGGDSFDATAGGPPSTSSTGSIGPTMGLGSGLGSDSRASQFGSANPMSFNAANTPRPDPLGLPGHRLVKTVSAKST